MAVGIKGGYAAAVKFHDALKLVTRLVNLGDAKSLACHPASTTHRQMSPEEQRNAGVLPEMIRLSIGIEHIDDILADLNQALHATLLSAREGEADAGDCGLFKLERDTPRRQGAIRLPARVEESASPSG